VLEGKGENTKAPPALLLWRENAKQKNPDVVRIADAQKGIDLLKTGGRGKKKSQRIGPPAKAEEREKKKKILGKRNQVWYHQQKAEKKREVFEPFQDPNRKKKRLGQKSGKTPW